MADTLLVLTTFPDVDTAGRVARALVEARLAACVNRVSGVASTYRWQGHVEEATETLLLIKTRRNCFDALRERVLALSPYATPELIALDISAGSPAYLDWIAAETRR